MQLVAVMEVLQCVDMQLCDAWSFSVVVSKFRVRWHFQRQPIFGDVLGDLSATWTKVQRVSD